MRESGRWVDGGGLRSLRRARGWDVPEMARQLRRAAGGDPSLPTPESLRIMIHRWEREGLDASRSERYELLYAKAFGISPEELPQVQPDGDAGPTVLRGLLAERHWGRFEAFEAQFARAARELAQRDQEPRLAQVTVSKRQFERWRAGTVRSMPLPDASRVLEYMFGIPVRQLLSPADTRVSEESEDVPGVDAVGFQGAFDEEDQEEMERRRLLQSLAVLGVQISPLSQALDSVRAAVGGTLGHDDRNHLDDWEETAVEYGYSYISTPPLHLIPNLAADLVSVRSIIRSVPSGTPEYRNWCRVSGVLSGLMAKSLSNIGQARDSRQWWNMAQHVTDESGDLGLRLWVRGERIVHGLYENRPVPILLRQVENAWEIAHGYSRAEVASISAVSAQVSALSGDTRSAENGLRRAHAILSALPSGATGTKGSALTGLKEDELRYAEAWVYAHAGDQGKADLAIERALALYPDTDSRTPAQVKLMQAFSRVRSGDITEGIQRARKVYEPISPEQRTTMVDALARRVLRSVPDDARDRPDVSEYRDIVVTPGGKEIGL